MFKNIEEDPWRLQERLDNQENKSFLTIHINAWT